MLACLRFNDANTEVVLANASKGTRLTGKCECGRGLSGRMEDVGGVKMFLFKQEVKGACELFL